MPVSVYCNPAALQNHMRLSGAFALIAMMAACNNTVSTKHAGSAPANTPAVTTATFNAPSVASYAVKFKPQFLKDHRSIKPEAEANLKGLGAYVLEFADFGPTATTTRGVASLKFPQIDDSQSAAWQKKLTDLQLFEYVEMPQNSMVHK